MTDEERAAVDAVLAAARAGDWDRVRLLLHPYLRFTAASGELTRGRTRVLGAWRRLGAAPEPLAVALRDGQVYRWQARGLGGSAGAEQGRARAGGHHAGDAGQLPGQQTLAEDGERGQGGHRRLEAHEHAEDARG